MEASNLTTASGTVNTTNAAVNSTEVFSSSTRVLAAEKVSLDNAKISASNSLALENSGQEAEKVEEDVVSAVAKEGTPKAGLEALAFGEEKVGGSEERDVLGHKDGVDEGERGVEKQPEEMSPPMSDIKETAGQDSYLRDQMRSLEQQIAESNARLEQNRELLILLLKFIEELRKKEQNNGILGVILQMIAAIINLSVPDGKKMQIN